MNTVFTLINTSDDLSRMINNIQETLGIFLTYDDAFNAMNKDEYKKFDMVIEEIEVGNANPNSNVIHAWEKHFPEDHNGNMIQDPIFQQLF